MTAPFKLLEPDLSEEDKSSLFSVSHLAFSHASCASIFSLLFIQRRCSVQAGWKECWIFPLCLITSARILPLAAAWLVQCSTCVIICLIVRVLKVQSRPRGHVCSYYSAEKGDAWQSGLSLLARTFWFSSPQQTFDWQLQSVVRKRETKNNLCVEQTAARFQGASIRSWEFQ